MNSFVRKSGLQFGLVASFFQILITTYLYNLGSFTDITFGLVIIAVNVMIGTITIVTVKSKQNNGITLRESFSCYFITILISIVISIVFYLTLFNTIATTSKRELVKKELFAFQLEQMKNSNFSDKDIQKNIELAKNSNPFGVTAAFQSGVKFLLIYSVLGIVISFMIKNKSSFQETP